MFRTLSPTRGVGGLWSTCRLTQSEAGGGVAGQSRGLGVMVMCELLIMVGRIHAPFRSVKNAVSVTSHKICGKGNMLIDDVCGS